MKPIYFQNKLLLNLGLCLVAMSSTSCSATNGGTSAVAETKAITPQDASKTTFVSLKWEATGATTAPKADGVGFVGDANLPYVGQAWASIEPRRKITVRAKMSPSAKFDWNNAGLLLGSTKSGHYVAGVLQFGLFKMSLDQNENVYKKLTGEEKTAPVPQRAAVNVEMQVDLDARGVFLRVGDASIALPLQADLPDISRIGLQSFHTGADFSQLEILDAAPDAGKVVAPKDTKKATANATSSTRSVRPISVSTDAVHKIVAKDTSALQPGALFFGEKSPDDLLSALEWDLQNPDNKTSIVPVQAMPFRKAVQVRVKERDGIKFWQPNFKLKNAVAVKKGQAIYLTLWCRSLVGGQSGKMKPFMAGRDGYDGDLIGDWEKPIPDTWTRLHFSLISNLDYAPGELTWTMHLGFPENAGIEIGGLTGVVFPVGTDKAKLPQEKMQLNYAGREPNAAWRKAAFARIEKFRKAGLKIEVVNAQGAPVKDVRVLVAMKRHAFLFGNEMPSPFIPGTEPKLWGSLRRVWEASDKDKTIYREKFLALFNAGVSGAGWWAWDPNADVSYKDEQKQIAWLQEHGVAGVNATPIYRMRYSPTFVNDLVKKRDKAGVQRAFDEFLATYANYVKPYPNVRQFIVANEWDIEYDLKEMFGDQFIAEWFKKTRAAMPAGSRIGINDPAPIAPYLKRVQSLIDAGQKPDFVALQTHLDIGAATPEQWLQTLRPFVALKIPLQISELDVGIKDPKDAAQVSYQADMLRDYLIAAFSEPQIESVVHWGFWDPVTWLETRHVGFYDKDWKEKPNGKAFRELVTKTWWTNADGRSDAKGSYATRGFLGDYEITVSRGAQRKVVKTSLAKNGRTLRVVLN